MSCKKFNISAVSCKIKIYFSKLMSLTNFLSYFSNSLKLFFSKPLRLLGNLTLIVNCNQYLWSHVLVVLLFCLCVYFVIPFFALFICFFSLVLFLIS